MIRSGTPQPEDETVKLLLGKLCNPRLTAQTKTEVMNALTFIMKGKPLAKETFDAYGLKTTDIVDTEKNERRIVIAIPKEYVSAAVTENRDNQTVTFVVTDLTTPKSK